MQNLSYAQQAREVLLRDLLKLKEKLDAMLAEVNEKRAAGEDSESSRREFVFAYRKMHETRRQMRQVLCAHVD